MYILAASSNGDQNAIFRVGAESGTVSVQDWGGYIGQWDTRLWNSAISPVDWASSAHHQVWPPANLREAERPEPSPRYPEDYVGLREGFVKPAEVAWYSSHHHTAAGLNQPYAYSYLFAYALNLPAGATTLTLPNNPNIRILAISAGGIGPALTPATPLFDTLQHTSMPLAVERASH